VSTKREAPQKQWHCIDLPEFQDGSAEDVVEFRDGSTKDAVELSLLLLGDG
jgi:hypothetical protein